MNFFVHVSIYVDNRTLFNPFAEARGWDSINVVMLAAKEQCDVH